MHLSITMATQESTSVNSSRRTAQEILEDVAHSGHKELHRSSRALGFSGLAGGMTMGLTGLAVAIVRALLGPGANNELISQLFYPVGFIAVIIGRAQLFTENTLYPVVLVLEDSRHIPNLLRLWGVVFATNVFGSMLFALLMTKTSAVEPKVMETLAGLGSNIAAQAFARVLWSGVIGGWLIALVAWMVTASHWTVGQILVIWLLAFVVGVGQFSHCIASGGEIWCGVFTGDVSVKQYFVWLLPATVGNIIGGVTIVSLLNWGQVRAD